MKHSYVCVWDGCGCECVGFLSPQGLGRLLHQLPYLENFPSIVFSLSLPLFFFPFQNLFFLCSFASLSFLLRREEGGRSPEILSLQAQQHACRWFGDLLWSSKWLGFCVWVACHFTKVKQLVTSPMLSHGNGSPNDSLCEWLARRFMQPEQLCACTGNVQAYQWMHFVCA